MIEKFSERHGHKTADAEIVVREDAPESLRYAIPVIAKDIGMNPTAMRQVICQTLLVPPDSYNWSDYPNVWNEVNELISGCAWFKVYDIAEALQEAFAKFDSDSAFSFESRLNQFFRENGIGWEMEDGEILFRGSEVFSNTTEEAVDTLTEDGRYRAANEIHEALRDISRRPEPDVTGAIQHAFAGLEAIARDLTGQSNLTLGQLVPHLDLPSPLDIAIDKFWGFASDRARHIRENQTVDRCEAELLVIIACALCTFLSNRGVIDV